MIIDSFDTDKNILIIAEIGNNHEGSFTLAEEMIGRAAEAGANAVKFQTFRTEHYVSSDNKARIDMLKSFELSEDDFERLKKTADSAGVVFISTPFDIQSAIFLDHLVPAFKIASGDNTFYPLLDVVAKFGKPVILSCGLAGWIQIRYAKAFIERIWQEEGIDQQLALLHSVTSYPVPFCEANISAIGRLQKEFGGVVGYSDHVLGIEAAALSVAQGARIVEKHFTLDKNQSDFRDHHISADPGEFALLVERIRQVEELMGSGEKILQESEEILLPLVRRSIIATRDLPAGEIIRQEDITWVRPSGGIPPGNESLILGKTVKNGLACGEMITLEKVR